MKKKIIAFAMVIAMLAIIVVSGTLAYFTDTDEGVNVFTIGGIDIELTEKVGVYPSTAYDSETGEWDENKAYSDRVELYDHDGDGNYESTAYSNIMPTNYLQKEVTVTNTGRNAAYVRVAVIINNANLISRGIDTYYDTKYEQKNDAAFNTEVDALEAYEGLTGIDAYIAEMYDYIFDGWNINYGKYAEDIGYGVHSMRLTVDKVSSMSADAVLYDVDTTRVTSADSDKPVLSDSTDAIYDHTNLFKTDAEKNKANATTTPDNLIVGRANSYYGKILDCYETIRVYYLYLPAGANATLFKGLNVPAEFTNEQMKMFENLQIEVYADAIQAEGFDVSTVATFAATDTTTTAHAWMTAFEALEKAHPLASIKQLDAEADAMNNKMKLEKQGYTITSDTAEILNVIENGGKVALGTDITYASAIDNDLDVNLNGNTFEATNTLELQNNADLTMTGGAYEVNSSFGHVDVRPNSAEGSVVVFENVDFSFNQLGTTYGPSTNRLGSVVEICATVEGAKTEAIFRNCTFDNAQVLIEGMSGKIGIANVTFENCTFKALTSSAPIYVNNYVSGTLTVKNCTFNLECTSSSASAIYLSSGSSTSVELIAENNTINATAATPYTYDASKGETEYHNVKVNGTPANIKLISWYGDTTSTVTETGTVVSGIAAKLN